MPAPFYLGWAVMAVLALGSADMVVRVAGSLLRSHPANKAEQSEVRQRHVPRPKVREPRTRSEGQWF